MFLEFFVVVVVFVFIFLERKKKNEVEWAGKWEKSGRNWGRENILKINYMKKISIKSLR